MGCGSSQSTSPSRRPHRCVGTVGPDRMGTTERTAIPVSHRRRDLRSLRRKSVQEAFRVLWHARSLEMAACPAKLKDSGGKTPSNALSTSTPSWIRSTMRRRQQPPRPERDRSTFSAPWGQGRGVVVVSALQSGGGARRCRTKWRTLWTTTTLHSQRASPRCCGRGLAWKALLEVGWHGFRAPVAKKRSEAAPRVSPSLAPRRRGAPEEEEVVRATHVFWRWCATGQG